MDYKNDVHSDDDFDSYSDNYQQSNSGQSQNQQFNTSQGRLANPAGLSKAELRKTNKPIMEKRRRARINHCLNELKSLILEAMKKDPARHTKLEKADILEMTVKHLQSVQRQQLNMALQTDPTVIHKFKTGFAECADEVNRYVSQLDGVDETVRQRLNSHLNQCATSLDQIGAMTNFNNGYQRNGGHANLFGSNNLPLPMGNGGAAASLFPSLSQDFNSTQPIQMGGVQLIPSRLPSGEFALIMPNTGSSNNQATSLMNNNSNSGFPAWPSQTGSQAGSAQINDFAANFKRLSAFSKPPSTLITPPKVNPGNMYPQTNLGPTTATSYQPLNQAQPQTAFHNSSSPPLSPISSVSSHNEDSMMHNSSDFTNSRSTSPRHHQQDKHNSFLGVFNTPPSSAENSFVLSAAHLQQQQVSSSTSDLNTSSGSANSSLKRSFSEAADSSICSEDDHASKKYHKEAQLEGEDQDSMWRPW
ncbi:protein deadpan-like [Musca domestica]|uniref:Protein deadpan-like n=1 Tax=Musca domestica TaxID=7370 RepID=A0ABM3V1U2_MUSDO|nr:protein deadpan-like [Musca domestica]